MYEEVFGQTCESLYERPTSWLDVVHPEDRERVDAALERQLRTGKFLEEFRIIRPDGAIRWILDRVFMIQNEFGEAPQGRLARLRVSCAPVN